MKREKSIRKNTVMTIEKVKETRERSKKIRRIILHTMMSNLVRKRLKLLRKQPKIELRNF